MEKNEFRSWYAYCILPDEIKLSQEEFEQLWDEQPKDPSTIILFGKTIEIPRKQQSYGIPYTFSGKVHTAKPCTPLIQKYIDYANTIDNSPQQFNMAFLNWYANGESYIGFHSDDEPQIIKNSPIYCFSFGATRDFRFKDKNTGETILTVPLENNSLIVMGGDCQSTHKHSILKRLKVTSPRISITLRKFY